MWRDLFSFHMHLHVPRSMYITKSNRMCLVFVDFNMPFMVLCLMFTMDSFCCVLVLV